MSRTPWVLGKQERDPIDERRVLADRAERLSARVVRALGGSTGAPLVVVMAALDAMAMADPAGDLLPPAELARVAERTGIDLGDIDAPSVEQVRGYLSALRGAAGEYEVLDGLAAGTLPVPPGTNQVTLEGFTVPGVDLQLLGPGIDTAANVKIASSADVIVDHFSRFGEQVPIVYASSDAAADAASRGLRVLQAHDLLDLGHGPVVVDIGVPSTTFDDRILPYIGGVDLGRVGVGNTLDVVDTVGLLPEIPWFSVGMIGVRAVARLMAGMAAADVVRGVGGDALRAGTTLATGKVAAAAGLPEPASAAVVIAAGMAVTAALEVRRTWRDAADHDVEVGILAEDFLERWGAAAR